MDKAHRDNLIRDKMVSPPQTNVPRVPPGMERFYVPPLPTFGFVWSVLSILSLAAFAATAVGALRLAESRPLWANVPFGLVVFGAGLGFLYELALLIRGEAYQLLKSPLGRLIQGIRGGNLAFVFTSSYAVFAYLSIEESLGWPNLLLGVALGFLLVHLLFEGPPLGVGIVLLTGLITQLIIVWAFIDTRTVLKLLLSAHALLLAGTVVVGVRTPRQSTFFHLLGSAAVIALCYALTQWESPLALRPTRTVFRCWWMSLGVLAGVGFAFRVAPITFGRLRAIISNAVWPLFYLVIAGSERTLPKPAKLSELYGHQDLEPLRVLPYHVAHPRNLSFALRIPCLDENLSEKVRQFGFLTQLVRTVFALVSIVNRFFPFADTRVPLSNKPRLNVWSDGTEYWPWWLLQRIYLPRLGYFSIEAGVRGPGFQKTPALAVEHFQRGQLLAYLVEFGIGNAFLKRGRFQDQDVLELDLSFLESYPTKTDYEPYGGNAYYVIDEEQRRLKLIGIRVPRSNTFVEANPYDATFLRGQAMISASLYFYVVSGKHLVEIHMGLNLVEIAMLNGFDANEKWNHPIRTALYPHFFAHELAEELTTQNLVEDRGVFPQIFATTNGSLVSHLNDRFQEYQLGQDEDFERRCAVLMNGREELQLAELLPQNSLVWEQRYAAIWFGYATRLVDAVYDSDDDVRNDPCVQQFYLNMESLFLQPLPTRYHRFHTKSGLTRFISDTLHHLIIRHEVYGTAGVRLALDPRINGVQVPVDGGPPAVDEWRSLACIAMATSRVRYVKLQGGFDHVFGDLEDEQVRTAFQSAHRDLQERLTELQQEFENDGVDNYETLRLLPSDLDVGAGY